MKKTDRKMLWAAVGLLLAFVLWTLTVCFADVKEIGPSGSAVGLAGLNGFVHGLTGVHMDLYLITDWMGLIPVGFAAGFGLLGLIQWIRRKRLRRVDPDLLILGGFYLVVMAAYLFFETVAVNYRPVLIQGVLEASYPSSTTLLVLCVMPAAMEQLQRRIGDPLIRGSVLCILGVFTVFMVLARLISGVHWFTDIIGGGLLGGGLVCLYVFFSRSIK